METTMKSPTVTFKKGLKQILDSAVIFNKAVADACPQQLLCKYLAFYEAFGLQGFYLFRYGRCVLLDWILCS